MEEKRMNSIESEDDSSDITTNRKEKRKIRWMNEDFEFKIEKEEEL